MTKSNVLLLGWEAKGLRGYLREARIELNPHKYKHALLQMPNGTGKTTTMALLRSALAGELDSSISIPALQADRTVKEGYFELHLLIHGERVSIRITFDFEVDRHFYYTTTVRDGRRRNHLLAAEDPLVADALKRSIDLYVFDGELAQDMLKDGPSAADRAIEALYRTDAFKDLIKRIDSLKLERKNRNRDVSSATEQSAVDKREREFEAANEVLVRLTNEKDALVSSLGRIDTRVAAIAERRRQLGLEDDDFRDRQQDIEDRSEQTAAAISKYALEAIASFRSPLSTHPFVERRLKTLSATLKNRNLPRSSKSFFEILAQKPNCICGDEMNEEKREHILSNAEDYLGDEQVSVINDIRQRLGDQAEGRPFSDVVTDLNEAEDRLFSIGQERNRLDTEKAQAGIEEIDELDSESKSLLEERSRKDLALQFLTEEPSSLEDVDWKTNLPACEEITKKREKAFKTARANNQYFSAADILIEAASRSHKLANKRLREFVKDRANDQLSRILDNETIRVSRIEGRLHLVNEENLPKDGASEGQKLAVCYAFLTALLAEAPARLPFIVDSPAVSLDLDLRSNIGELIPRIFEQLIVFVISSEREGFADSFESRTDTQFITASINQNDGSVLIDDNKANFFKFQSGGVSA